MVMLNQNGLIVTANLMVYIQRLVKPTQIKHWSGLHLDSLGALFQRVHSFYSKGNLSASERTVSQSKGPVNVYF